MTVGHEKVEEPAQGWHDKLLHCAKKMPVSTRQTAKEALHRICWTNAGALTKKCSSCFLCPQPGQWLLT
jgi:hypothetical protein